MMSRITINRKIVDVEQKLMLNNGDLLIYGDKSFFVSTYGDNAKYCSLIDLESGARICPEPVSRNSTRKRVCAHMRYKIAGFNGGIKYNKLEHYKKDAYEINISVKVSASNICSDAVYAQDMNDTIENKEELSKYACPNCGHIEIRKR